EAVVLVGNPLAPVVVCVAAVVPAAGNPLVSIVLCGVPGKPFGPTLCVAAVAGNPFEPIALCGVPGNPFGPTFGVPSAVAVAGGDETVAGKPVGDVCVWVSRLIVGTLPDCACGIVPGGCCPFGSRGV